MCGCVESVGGASASASAQGARTLYELDFSAQPTIDPLPTGPVTIDGIAWTSQFQGTTFRVLNGTGLQFVADATSTAYTSATQTAASLELPMSTIYSALDIDVATELVFEIFIASLVAPTPNDEVVCAIRGTAGSPANSANRMAACVRGNRALAQVVLGRNDGASSSNYTTDAAATNVIGIRTHGESADALAGNWTGTWPRLEKHISRPKGAGTASASSRDRLGFFGIAFATGNINADMSAVVERLRIRTA